MSSVLCVSLQSHRHPRLPASGATGNLLLWIFSPGRHRPPGRVPQTRCLWTSRTWTHSELSASFSLLTLSTVRVPTVLQMREKINTNCYKFKIKDGSFITLRSRWFSFMNPWTKEVEYIVSTNTVVSWVARDTRGTQLWDVRTFPHVCMLICPGVLWWKDQTTLNPPPRLRAWTVFSPQKVKPWKTHTAVLKSMTHPSPKKPNPRPDFRSFIHAVDWQVEEGGRCRRFQASPAARGREPARSDAWSRRKWWRSRGESHWRLQKLEGRRNPARPRLEPHRRR